MCRAIIANYIGSKMTTREIKKYANRRLYDTGASRYVKNADLVSILKSGESLSVIDAQNGHDITRSVLFSILAELAIDDAHAPVLTQAILAEVVRFDDDYLVGILGRYLETSMQVFLAHKETFRAQMRDFDAEDPFATLEKLIAAQEQVLREAKQTLVQAKAHN